MMLLHHAELLVVQHMALSLSDEGLLLIGLSKSSRNQSRIHDIPVRILVFFEFLQMNVIGQSNMIGGSFEQFGPICLQLPGVSEGRRLLRRLLRLLLRPIGLDPWATHVYLEMGMEIRGVYSLLKEFAGLFLTQS